MLRTVPILACLVAFAGCTPVGEAWQSSERLDESWIPPASPAEAQAPTMAADRSPETAPNSSATVTTPAVRTCDGRPAAPSVPLHPDLALDLQTTGASTLEPGQWIEVAGRLRNRSKTASHRVVLPGDGSEVAWREPQVWYSGFVDTGDGCWKPLETLEVARCGLFDEGWQDDVIELSPEQTRSIEWMGNPTYMLDIQRAGRVRLFMHYAYRQGQTGRAAADTNTSQPVDAGEMRDSVAFELVSNPVEFTLVRPLELTLVPKPHRGLGNIAKVSDVVELSVTNVGAADRAVMPPSSSRLRFEVQGDEPSWPQGSYQPSDDALASRMLEASDSMELLGPTGPNPGLSYSWTPAKAEVVRIRAAYRPYEEPGGAELRSAWIEVDLR